MWLDENTSCASVMTWRSVRRRLRTIRFRLAMVRHYHVFNPARRRGEERNGIQARAVLEDRGDTISRDYFLRASAITETFSESFGPACLSE